MMSEYRVKSGSVVVDPAIFPISMAGFSDRKDAASYVDSSLEINVILLYCGTSKAALISFDTLSIGSRLRLIAQQCLPDFDNSSILLCASHTHFAPALDSLLPKLGETEEHYLEMVDKAFRKLLLHVLSTKSIPVDLRYTRSTTDQLTVNRRRVVPWLPTLKGKRLSFNRVVNAPNPQGVKDESVHAVGCYPQDGVGQNPIALFWSYPCHPVCQPYKGAISSDFPGDVRASMRQIYPKLGAVAYLQGFCGDVRPNITMRLDTLKSILLWVLKGGRNFGSFNSVSWKAWTSELCAALQTAVNSQIFPKGITFVDDGIISSETFVPISVIQTREVKDRPPLHFQRIRIGKELLLTSVSAEVVSSYALDKHKITGSIHVGYTDHIHGYIPTNDILKEGGYEAEGFREAFSLPGTYRENLEAIVRKVITEL